METIYQNATRLMNIAIAKYFEIVELTKNFSDFSNPVLNEDRVYKQILLSGKHIEFEDSLVLQKEMMRVEKIPFNIEDGVSAYVYQEARKHIKDLLEVAKDKSNNYSNISDESIKDNPYLLPIWQSVLAIPSKSHVKKLFGSVSDVSISGPASKKISEFANGYLSAHTINESQVIERTERTLEGIVRDLVGKLLFESIVRNALKKEGVPFLEEKEYKGIKGVVYDFRADFVIPNEKEPLAFIEVRKSSSRHASLYAKDKMFSAINWKGKNKDMLAIIVAEGEWTNESLRAMAKVFDFVVPVSSTEMLAKEIKKYINGDKSVLKWIINFDIQKNILD